MIFDNTSSSGRYLRLYQTVDNDCQIVEEDNVQVPWKDFIHGIDGVWRVLLTQENKVPDFKVGQLIGVKSKCCGDGHWT